VQGRGTFVAEPRSPLEEVWQFRFVERPGGDLLPVKIELIDRRKAKAEGPWRQLLAAEGSDLCELRRRVIVNNSFFCVSQFFVAAKRFPKLSRMPVSAINLNLKIMLAERFGAITHSLDQYLQATAFEDDICNYLALPRKAKGTALHSLGRLSTGEIISYQYLAIPPGRYLLAAPVTDNAWSSLPKA
jgi:DNA-binding GntR family transcriptional regulator